MSTLRQQLISFRLKIWAVDDKRIFLVVHRPFLLLLEKKIESAVGAKIELDGPMIGR